jgi:hypothetical protein
LLDRVGRSAVRIGLTWSRSRVFRRSLPRVLKEAGQGVWRGSDKPGIRRRSSDAHHDTGPSGSSRSWLLEGKDRERWRRAWGKAIRWDEGVEACCVV